MISDKDPTHLVYQLNFDIDYKHKRQTNYGNDSLSDQIQLLHMHT